MAKKSKYERIALKCKECGKKNYYTTKNPINTKEKLVLKRFCNTCKKHTEHEEAKVK